MLGIEDKWIAPACRLCVAVPLSLLMVLANSFTQKLDEAQLSFCSSSNKSTLKKSLNSSLNSKTLKPHEEIRS
jgi:hypothetical protein